MRIAPSQTKPKIAEGKLATFFILFRQSSRIEWVCQIHSLSLSSMHDFTVISDLDRLRLWIRKTQRQALAMTIDFVC